MAEVRMPKMGDGMEEGTINRWLKKEGDHIASGDSLAEVETDKANVEIPVYESGILTRIVVQVGQTVPVGEVIAHIGAPTTGGNGATSGAVNSGDARGASSGEEAGAAARKPRRAEFRSPSGAPDDASAASAERIKSSPLARKMAGELGIDLARVPGSGPGGRVVERDVTNYMQSHADLQLLRASAAPAPPTPPEPAPAAAAAPPTAPARAFSGTETKPSNMRAAIARRTLQSKQNIPHFYVTMVVEMDRALGMLKELNTDAASGKVTVNDVVIKASAVALGKVPEVNATWTPEGTVRRYTEAHVGMAVGIDEEGRR